jgi:hypothetical protein
MSTIPVGYTVRFDHHRRPRATTAVITSNRTRNVVAVGVAKFNAKDGAPSRSLGEKIALGRALAALENPQARRTSVPKIAVGLPTDAGLDPAVAATA